MFRKILLNLLIYLGIILIFLPIFEVVLENFNPEQIMVHVEDPDIVYQFYPNREGIAFSQEYKVKVKTNSIFMRDCENPFQNFGNGKILVLGDSFSEGWGVECKEAYHFPLNEHFQILNGAIHGGSLPYYIVKSRAILPKYKPDILLIQIFDNDLDDSDKVEKFFNWKDNEILSASPKGFMGFPAGKISTFLRELTLTRLTRKIIAGLKGQKEPIKYYKPNKVPNLEILDHQKSLDKFGRLKPINDFEKEYNGQFAFYKFKNTDEINNDPLWKRRFETFESLADQLIREVREKNQSTKIIFIYIPAKESLHGFTNSDDYYRKNPFLQLLQKITKKSQTELIDTSKILSDDPEKYYFPGDAHLNRDGHRVLTEYLVKFLK
jgi:hypothetical protein